MAAPGGAPSNFTAIGMSSTSLLLRWDPPAPKYRNGKIILYEVTWYPRSDSTSSHHTRNTTDTSMMIDGLEVSTDYSLQIRAYNNIGPGPWSNRLPFRTCEQRQRSGFQMNCSEFV